MCFNMFQYVLDNDIYRLSVPVSVGRRPTSYTCDGQGEEMKKFRNANSRPMDGKTDAANSFHFPSTTSYARIARLLEGLGFACYRTISHWHGKRDSSNLIS